MIQEDIEHRLARRCKQCGTLSTYVSKKRELKICKSCGFEEKIVGETE